MIHVGPKTMMCRPFTKAEQKRNEKEDEEFGIDRSDVPLPKNTIKKN